MRTDRRGIAAVLVFGLLLVGACGGKSRTLGGPTSDGESETTDSGVGMSGLIMGGTETSSSSGDATSVFTTGGGSGGSSPPFDTFEPNHDIGDGTLGSEELLLIAQTPEGVLHLWWTPERLGDTFQGYVRAAAFVDASWQAAGTEVRLDASDAVIDNYVPLNAEALLLPAGTHPFGAGAVTVNLFLDAYLYADTLLCGQIDIEVQNGSQHLDQVFVTKRIDVFGDDPMPPVSCN